MIGHPCAAEACESLTLSPMFEFCLPHWNRLREIHASRSLQSFRLKWPFRRGSPGWALEVRKCVAALATDEGVPFDPEPLE